MTEQDTAGTAAGWATPSEQPSSPSEQPSSPEGTGRATAARRGKGYFVPGFIALVALLGIGLFVGAGDLQHPAATTISGADIASQIALGIQAQQDLAAAPPVTCPRDEPVRQGLRFQCTLGGGAARPVYVTETDGRGRVRWSLKGF